MLLVEDDQAEVVDGREDGAARADGDPGLVRPEAAPLVVALALGQRGVQQRDRVPEARLEARDRLRRERDLGHEHDHALPAGQARLRRAEVHLGLARAGDAVQQVGAARVDGRERVDLGLREVVDAVLDGVRARRAALGAFADRDQAARLEPAQRGEVLAGRAGQAVEQLALLVGELAGLARGLRVEVGLGLAGRRRDDGEGARRRGAVLLGDPVRQVHQVLRDRVVADATWAPAASPRGRPSRRSWRPRRRPAAGGRTGCARSSP